MCGFQALAGFIYIHTKCWGSSVSWRKSIVCFKYRGLLFYYQLIMNRNHNCLEKCQLKRNLKNTVLLKFYLMKIKRLHNKIKIQKFLAYLHVQFLRSVKNKKKRATLSLPPGNNLPLSNLWSLICVLIYSILLVLSSMSCEMRHYFII